MPRMSKELTMCEQICDLPDGMGRVRISSAALKHIFNHRQDRLWKNEAGGQLFASFSDKVVTIEIATGPHRGDKRARYSFIPNRAAERKEIEEMYEKGLHYVGDWHSHPELRPRPSSCDRTSMSETVVRSARRIPGFFLIIVGTSAIPESLYLCLVMANRQHELQLCPIP